MLTLFHDVAFRKLVFDLYEILKLFWVIYLLRLACNGHFNILLAAILKMAAMVLIYFLIILQTAIVFN